MPDISYLASVWRSLVADVDGEVFYLVRLVLTNTLIKHNLLNRTGIILLLCKFLNLPRTVVEQLRLFQIDSWVLLEHIVCIHFLDLVLSFGWDSGQNFL